MDSTGQLCFYGWWDWRFLTLIMISTFMDYNFGKLIGATEEKGKRRIYLILSMIMNLGFLGFFKYFNFFIDSFISMMHAFGFQPSVSMLQIMLPIGISFYTFQSLSYTIDIYRREIPVERNMLKFAAFIALFPQLVAGPIVRARDLLPQMNTDKKFDWDNFNSGLGRVLWGFFKKVAIADSLAPFVDQCWADPSKFSSSHLMVGVVFIRSRSIVISRAIRISRLAWHVLWVTVSLRTLKPLIFRKALVSSGHAGIFLFPAGCGITCIFRSAAIGKGNSIRIKIT